MGWWGWQCRGRRARVTDVAQEPSAGHGDQKKRWKCGVDGSDDVGALTESQVHRETGGICGVDGGAGPAGLEAREQRKEPFLEREIPALAVLRFG